MPKSRSTTLPFQQTKDLLIPDRQVFSLYFFTSLSLLIIFNVKGLLDFLGKKVIEPQDVLRVNFDVIAADVSTRLGELYQLIAQSRFAVAVFWALVGIVTYLLIWFLLNVKAIVQADWSAQRFASNRSDYWRFVLGQIALLVVSIVGFGVLIILSIREFLPLLANYAYHQIYNFDWPGSLLRLLIVVLLTCLLVHVLIVLLRLIGRAWRLI